MIWGCIPWEGVGEACKIDGRMDGNLYIKILEDGLQSSLALYDKTPQGIIFQQDNDPCKKAQNCFQDHDMEVLLWPPHSPDLNPIEHLWNHLKWKLADYEVPPHGIWNFGRVQKEWGKIKQRWLYYVLFTKHYS